MHGGPSPRRFLKFVLELALHEPLGARVVLARELFATTRTRQTGWWGGAERIGAPTGPAQPLSEELRASERVFASTVVKAVGKHHKKTKLVKRKMKNCDVQKLIQMKQKSGEMVSHDALTCYLCRDVTGRGQCVHVGGGVRSPKSASSPRPPPLEEEHREASTTLVEGMGIEVESLVAGNILRNY